MAKQRKYHVRQPSQRREHLNNMIGNDEDRMNQMETDVARFEAELSASGGDESKQTELRAAIDDLEEQLDQVERARDVTLKLRDALKGGAGPAA